MDSFSGDNVAKVLNGSLKEGALGWLEFESSLPKELENFLQIAQVVWKVFPRMITSFIYTRH